MGSPTNGDDVLVGTDGNDTIDALAGNDRVTGGKGADKIYGGSGNDTVVVNAGDAQTGETLDGGADVDTLLLGDNANLAADNPTTNFETLLIDYRATIGANQLADFSTISGNGGSSGSRFYLTGASAGSYSFAGKTVDSRIHFTGSSGNDTITGSSGDDWISGGVGADHISAGSGNDTVYVAAGDTQTGETLDGGADVDTLLLGDNANLAADNPTTNFETLLIDYRATIGANQLADFSTISGNGGSSGSRFYLTGASAGSYSFAGKTVDTRIHFTGSSGNDTITGSSGNDWISGGVGADYISAGSGNDTVYIGAGDAQTGETLDGGADVDTLLLGDNANLAADNPTTNFETLLIDYRATIGANQLADFSTISGNGGSSGSRFYLTGASAGSYSFVGKTVDTRIHFTGSSGNDTITGSAGNDWISGGTGADHISAGSGNDTVYIAAGDTQTGETLDGGYGTDTLLLGDNANLAPDNPTTNFDTLAIDYRATIGANQISDFFSITGDGGSSGSTFYLYGASAGAYSFAGKTVDTRIHFIGSSGNDTITGSSGNDWISGSTGADRVSSGSGNDTVYVAAGDAQTGETLDGGADVDTLLLGDNANLAADNPTTNFETLLIDYRATIGANQLADFSTISGNGGSSGSRFYLTGASAGSYSFADKTVDARIHFTGSSGNDTITGSSGEDWISGGVGADHISAGSGNDTVYIGAGDAQTGETLDGGSGVDTLLLSDNANFAPDNPTTNFDTLAIDYRATVGANQLADFSTISGDGGSSGSIFYLYGASAAVYDFSGKTVDSRIHFIGSTGHDTITGSSGNDWLNGGGSSDTLTGGAGNDTFAFAKGELAGDIIKDFQGAGVGGGDTLRLSGYGSGATLQHDTGSAYTVHFGTSGAEHLTIVANATLTTSDYTFV